MHYNLRVKTYSDGVKQYFYSEKTKERGYKQEKKEKTGGSVERKELDNMKRARAVVYDLARNNVFDWFVTLTISPDFADRLDYDSCVECVYEFTQWMKDQNKRGAGFSWLMVPEQHKKGGYHFHGLVQGELPVTPAINPHTGDLIKDKAGRQVYNIVSYKWGYTTATQVGDMPKAAGYLTKYLSKDMTVPKGRKRYWASRSLMRPAEEHIVMSSIEVGELLERASYSKFIPSPYGDYVLFEVPPTQQNFYTS